MASYNFDDGNIRWNKLGDFEHLLYSVVDVDEKNKTVDFLLKLAANQQIFLHRHLAQNNTFVVQGEHRIYEPNGNLKEIRPVGSYTVSQASNEPHREGGGDMDAVVLFSVRGNDGVLYEVLDDDCNRVATLSMQDIMGLYKAQQENL